MNNLLLRRRALMGIGGKEALPYDAKIEYLESTGTQYIEIPFGFYKTDEIEITLAMLTSLYDSYLICTKTWNNDNNRFGIGGGDYYNIGYGSAGTNVTYLTPKTANDMQLHRWAYKDYKFEVVDLGLSFDVSAISFGTETSNLKLFYGYSNNKPGRLSYYKQIKNGVKVIELIPVRVGQVGYMYDKVSGNLFGNDGTGDFVLGNDIR